MHVANHLGLDQLETLAKQETGKNRFRRLHAVILALRGRTAPEIAEALGVGRRTVQEWIARYNVEGIDGLNDRPGRGRPCRLSEDQLQQLRDRIDAGPTPEDGVCTLRGPEIRALVQREFGVTYSPAAIYFILHRLGYEPLDPRPRHIKADPEAQEAFKKKVADRLDEISQEHPNKRVEVWFEDEARLGQKGTLTTVWARRGSRPTAVRQTQYDYLWVIAAACPASGAATGIIMPSLDTDVINVFLKEFSRQLAPDVHAVLIWDGAGFHTSGSLEVPENVTLLRLPPYSPELNPIENLWHYLRAHYWSNRSYEDWEALKLAAIDGLLAVGTDPERIKSVCAAPYLGDRGRAIIN